MGEADIRERQQTEARERVDARSSPVSPPSENLPRADAAPRGDATPKAKPAPEEDEAADNEDGSHKETPAERRRAHRRSIIIRTIFALIVLAAIIAGVFYWLSTRGFESTDDAYTDGRSVTIAPQVSGYVIELDVNDNQFVHKGDVLLRIDPRDYQAARDRAAGALAVAKGQLEGAEASLARAKITFPAALLAARGNLEVAKGNAFRAETDYKRQHGISREATTQQSVDASTAALQQAQGQVQQAEAQVTEATPVPQNIDVATASRDQLAGQVQQAQADLDRANLNLGYTVIRAPQDGWVTRRNVEVGNYAQPGNTVMDLVSPQVWVTANFKEDQLASMRPGQKVTISVDAYPSLKLTGHVDSIQEGSGSRFSAFPAENATGNFVKIVQRVPVKIDIDSGMDPEQPLPLGLSVEPTVRVGTGKPQGNAGGRDPGDGRDVPAINRFGDTSPTAKPLSVDP
jgi:membrane fusion protein (multidrug efflux system)